MLWLYNKYNLGEIINFYQIFVSTELVYDDDENNTIYSLESSKNKNVCDLEINCLEHDDIVCDVKMIDNIISYDLKCTNNIEKNKNHVFMFKSQNINEFNFNKANNLSFVHNYKTINTKRLPNLIESEYNFYSTLNFQIYNLEKNKVQFIIETNPTTNSVKKYFITTEPNLIKKYLI
jgi:hypothetical protein